MSEISDVSQTRDQSKFETFQRTNYTKGNEQDAHKDKLRYQLINKMLLNYLFMNYDHTYA